MYDAKNIHLKENSQLVRSIYLKRLKRKFIPFDDFESRIIFSFFTERAQ